MDAPDEHWIIHILPLATAERLRVPVADLPRAFALIAERKYPILGAWPEEFEGHLRRGSFPWPRLKRT